MKMTRIPEAEGANPDGILAMTVARGHPIERADYPSRTWSGAPAYRHGVSDLMLFVVAGAMASSSNLKVAYHSRPGHLRCYIGDEELRVRNIGTVDLTMLAFLAPKFAAS